MEHLYLIKIFGVVALAFVFGAAEKIIVRYLRAKVANSVRIWDAALIDALHIPLRLYICLFGLVFPIVILEQTFLHDSFIASWIENFYKGASFFFFIWAFFRFVTQFESRFFALHSTKYDPTTVRGISQVLKVVVVFICLLSLLQFLGIPLSGVIAFGGIGGIAVGFAAKDLLANVFGGLMVFLDGQFQIGDWIRSPDKEIEGTVEHIGWRLTRIRTLDKRPLFIPNSIFSTIALENPSRMSNRRIKTLIALNYADSPKLAAVLMDLEKMLQSHPEIDHSMARFAKLVDFGSYGLNIQIYAFTKETEQVPFHSVQQDILLKVLEVIDAHGARVARSPIFGEPHPP